MSQVRFTPNTTRRRRSDILLGSLAVLPIVVLISVLFVYPLVDAVILSLYDTSLLLFEPVFVGLGNYTQTLTSRIFSTIAKNSLLWTGVIVAGQALLGFSTAMLLQEKFIGRGFVRGLAIVPWATPGVIIAMVWRLLFDPQLGAINPLFKAVGIVDQPVAWLSSPSTALWAVIFVAIWKGFPFSMLMYLAGLQSIPQELIEAARIDGASIRRQITSIIIPAMMPVIRTTLLLTTVWTFNYFELVYVMTGGGPGRSSHIFPTFIYQLAFQQSRTSEAATYSILGFLVLSVFALLYVIELNRKGALDT